MRKLKEFFDLELFFKCFCLWIFVYSSCIALIESLLYSVLVSVTLHFIIVQFSLSPPNEDTLTTVLGENPRKKFRESIILDRESYKVTIPFAIAHRAAELDHNIGNLEAIKSCSKIGCKFIHLDVNLTIDNVPVISRKLNLLSKDNQPTLNKSIEECDYDEISFAFKNEIKEPNLCTIEEALPLIEQLGVKMLFNIIHSSYYKSSDHAVNSVLSIYEKHKFLYKNAIICSTNPLILYKIRKQDPSILVALKWAGFSEPSATSISWLKNLRGSNTLRRLSLELLDSFLLWILSNILYRVIGVSAVILPKEIITPKIVENWDHKGVRCIAGIVNLSSEKFYYVNALGIAYLTDTLLNEVNPK